MKSTPLICAVFSITVGVCVLLGWYFDISALKTVLPGFVTMKANTALAFILSGTSLLLLAPQPKAPWRAWLGRALALTVCLIGLATLGEEAFGWNLGIDELLVKDTDAVRVLTSAPGRMSLASTIAFPLLGLALLSIDWTRRRGPQPADVLALLVFGMSAIATMSYAFGRDFIHPFIDSTRMPVHTFVAFFVVGTGVLAARPDRGVVGAIRARMASPLERWVYGSLAASLFALLISGAASFFAAQDTATRSRLVDHTHEVRRQLALVLSTHRDLQVGSRGYIITGKPEFLQPYNDAREEADRIFQALVELVRDNPVQTARLVALDVLRRQQVAWTHQLVELAQRRSIAAAARMVATGEGKRLMDSLRDAIAQMDAEEAGLLRTRANEERASIARLNGTLAASTLLALFVLVFASIVIHRDFGRRQRAEQTIREQNEQLEQRVRERTAELRDAEARLRTVFDNLTEGVAVSGLDGRLQQFNPAAVRIHGFSSRDEYLRSLPEFQDTFELSGLDGAVWPVEQWPLARILRGEELRELEVRVRRKHNGWQRVFSYGGALARDSDGQPLMAILTMRDVTERKQAEQEIAGQRAFLRQVIDLDHNFVFAKDREGRFTLVNQAVADAYGTTVENLVGKSDHEFNPNREEVEQFRRDDIEVMNHRMEKFVPEEKITDATGRVRWLQTVKRPIVGPDGRADMILGVATDITERKRSEARIRGQLEHLRLLDHITRATGERQDLKSIFQVVVRSLEDSLPVDFGCVCLYDPATNALTVSSVGAGSAVLAHELAMDEQAVIDVDANGLSRCIQGQLVYEPDVGRSAFPFPSRLARAGLRSVVMAPLKSESRVFGILVVARRHANAFDSVECEFLRQLSEHVALAAHQAQLYGSLQEAYDELRETQAAAMQEERLRALGQMASGIAHDINNTLSPVSLYAESLLETEKNLSARARGYLETIQRAVDDVAETVARMREFYRQREQQLELAPVDLNQVVQQVLDLTQVRWSDMPQQHGISIEARTELVPDLPKIMGVESEIREALVNLVFNAVDAMPEGGRLMLRTRVIGGNEAESSPAVAIEVVDTGVGMDEDTRRRCLEPFFSTKGSRGTGLGLAMVFGTVQRHSAEIEIDSAPCVGTTIRLVFAVQTATIAQPDLHAQKFKVPSRLRLLLVDDDPVLLKSLRDALEVDGHLVVTANGGQAGVDEFRAALGRGDGFAAVFTDLGMPYVDGRKVATAVKEASPATPVILLTGWGRRLVDEGDIPPNVDRVLAKPPKLREVREALAHLCNA